jgi:hypothetical protein
LAQVIVSVVALINCETLGKPPRKVSNGMEKKILSICFDFERKQEKIGDRAILFNGVGVDINRYPLGKGRQSKARSLPQLSTL